MFNAGLAAKAALLSFLARGTQAAVAVLEVLDHHFAADYSEIHGEAPTVTFTPEFDRVLLTGQDGFERHVADATHRTRPAPSRG